MLGFAAGAQAQVLASNIGQADGGTVTFQRDHAMPFTPGLNPGGYRLESVDIEFASATSSAFDSNVLAVEIRRSDAHLRVGELVGRLTNPQGTSFAADRRIRFTAPGGGIDLEPRDGPRDGRAYYLVLDVAGQRDADFAKIRTTTSIADDAGGAAGFNIGAGFNWRMAGDNTAAGWTWAGGRALKIRLNGTAKGPPAPPGLEFSTTHLTWNESQGCGEFEYYDPSGNKIEKREGESAQQLRERARKVTAPWQTGMHSTPGASMELPASAPGPKYKVRLTTKPSETVKVNVHDPNDLIWWGNNTHRTLSRVLVGRDRRASNGRGGAGKPTLTFTPSNWNQWQTVKAKVACTDHFPDAVPLKHVIQGEQGDFDGAKRRVNYGELDQSWTVWVRVKEAAPPVEIEAESKVSGLPPAGETITLAEGATRDFKITIGEAMLPIGSSGRVDVHLFAEPVGNVIRATRRDGQPLVDGVLMDTMTFTNSSREQWVRLEAVGAGDTRLVVSAERDFTWAHETRRHWSPEWPVTVTVEHAGICGRTKAVRDAILGKIGVSNCADVTPEHLAGISGDFQNDFLNLISKGLSSLKAGDFDGLINLKRLRLTRNSLSTLPAGIFDDLTGLLALDLNYNQLTTLRPGVFDRLTKLKYLYLNNNSLAVLPDGVFRNNLALATHRLDENPGANFTPTANAGTDQTVATGAEVTLSSTATGPWAENDIAWHWRQVDGPYSDGVVQGGVQRDGQTATFTAPATATVMHFRLAATPKVLVESRPNVSGVTPPPPPIRERGIFDGFAWVTITVEGGQGSPAQAAPAPTETVANLQLAAVDDTSATATWDAVAHATSYDVSWDANGSETAVSGAESVTGTSATIEHNAQEAMTLTVTVTPEYIDGNGVVQRLDALAATATLAVGPTGDALSADTQSTDNQAPACVSDALLAEAQLAASETWRSSDHVERWSRVLAAFGEENAYSSNPMTITEAQAQVDRGLKRWAPVAPALECLANQPQEAAPQEEEEQPVTLATPELSLSAGSAVDEGSNASFTITADPAPSSDLTIAYSVAQSGEYLAAPGAGARTTTLAAGTTSTTLTVATEDDAADEADGSVTVTIDTASGYSIATGKGSGAVTITDNDTPVVSITAGPGVTEGTDATFTVTAEPVPAAPLDVTLTITQSGDFAASGQIGSRTVTIPVAGSATFSVATDDDTADEPDGSVTASVDAGTGYAVAAAPANAASVAVSDNDAATSASGPTISIADATMNENQHNGWFTVTLSEKVAWPVHVYYATRDSSPVSAVAGQDYLAWKRSWQLRARFRPGQTETKIHVPLYNDSHDEDPETFEMVLFDAGVNGPPGMSVSIADGVAVGTIVNDDPMPAAWLSRFGRTVAEQALDAVAGRMAAARTPGLDVALAGHALGAEPDEGEAGAMTPSERRAARAEREAAEAMAEIARGIVADTHGTSGDLAADPMSVDARDALLASGFTLTTGSGDGGSTAFWGRAARSGFDGHDGTFSLDGEATTVTLGADHARGRWLAGLALLRSSGDGSYRDDGTGSRDVSRTCAETDPEARAVPCDGAVREGDGTVEATLSAAVPYAALQASERIGLWGAIGTGTGEVTLRPETGGALSSDLSWSMAAAGLRGELLDGTGRGSGPALAVVSDALWTRTRSERTHELAASGSATSRLRLGLEGGWTVALGNGGSLSPRLEAGLRHDGGDAETGFGIDLGGGIAWTDPGRGLSLGLSGRTLVAHEDGDFRDRGLALDVAWDPRPETGRGWSASLSRSLGGSSSGGVAALLGPDAFPDASPGGGGAWSAEVAHGTALGAGMVASPYGRVGGTLGAKDEVRLGWRAGPDAPHAEDTTLDLWAEPVTGGGGRAVGAGLEWRW